MIEGGEDPRFIVRRMVILASEDVGNADPQALVVAVAAAHAVEHVGMPEAAHALAQAAVYLVAGAEVERRVPRAGRAREHVREHGAELPPARSLRSRRRAGGGGLRLPARPPGPRVRRRSSCPTRSRGRGSTSPTSRSPRWPSASSASGRARGRD